MRKLIWNQRRLEVYRSRLDSGNGAKVAVGRQRHPQVQRLRAYLLWGDRKAGRGCAVLPFCHLFCFGVHMLGRHVIAKLYLLFVAVCLGAVFC